MRPLEWIFVGSQINGDTFMADVEGQLVTTYRDPLSLLDNPLELQSNDDTIYEVNPRLMPAIGTPVEIEFADPRVEAAPRVESDAGHGR